MAKKLYPLQQVLLVKKDRVEKAEKVVQKKKQALTIEEDKLKKIEEARNLVLNHHNSKLAQLREALDKGTTSNEVLQMKSYLKVVKEKLEKEEKKVETQQQQVKIAKRDLQEAQDHLKIKRVEEEKLSLHKEAWDKEVQAELIKKEAKEQDEIGQIVYTSQKKKQKES
ncbi:MAG: type III secretion T3S chaperone [Chlamydiales bacterium]